MIFAYLLAETLEAGARDAWVKDYGARLRQQATGNFPGCVDLGMSSLSPDARQVLGEAAMSVAHQVEANGALISANALNRLGLGGGMVFHRDVDPEDISALACVVSQLLSATWPWSSGDEQSSFKEWRRLHRTAEAHAAPGTPGHAANRLLRRRRVSGEARGSRSYYSAADGLPAWALSMPDVAEVVGVYENHPGQPAHALVFYGEALAVLDGSGRISEVLKYEAMKNVVPFSKDPVADSLTVEMDDGREVTFAVRGSPGEVSLLARFIFNVRRIARNATS
ncbi:MAG: hypothetical protein HC927_11530 [Deltaproteobacteria bacterium]|nr:hypothetical protein [Deltaproteobacteria bacterium]